MESTKSTTRVTRTRGKSMSTSEPPASNSDVEMAPNLNGNKDGGVDTENVASDNSPSKENESGRPSRKRKLTDMKSDEEDGKDVKESKESKDSSDKTKEDTKPEPKTNETEGKVEKEDKEERVEKEDKEEKVDKEELNNTNQSDETPQLDASDANSSAENTGASTNSDAQVADSINNDLKIISSGTETYGKGKRARVPNKRYSDIIRASGGRTPKSENVHIPRTPKTSAPSASVKNGEFPDDDLVEILREESEQEIQKPAVKKIKSSVDMSNVAYLKPFTLGWKRELVFRSTFTDGKRNGDIYYYSPTGKKLRSMREIADYIGDDRDLSLLNFTYFKGPVGIDDPAQEIIREAKKGSGGGGVPVQMSRKAVAKILMKSKNRSKPVSHPPPSPSPPPTKISKPTRSSSSFKIKAPVKPGPKKNIKDKKAPKSPIKKGKSSVDRKPCQPCSIRCEGMQGLVPCLQCRICLCLYHNECVGIAPQINVQGYVCKNCQREQEPSDGNSGTNLSTPNILLPNSPVTPAQPSAAVVTNTDNTMTSEQRNADSNSADLSPNSKLKLNNNNTEQKSLVGSLTTWFPQSSTIQVSNSETDSLANVPRRPQLVEYIGNKKYVVVPRHNILSVRSPAHADLPIAPRAPKVASACPVSPSEKSACDPTQIETPAQGECTKEASTSPVAADEKAPEPIKASPIKPRTKEVVRTAIPRPGPPNFMNTYMQNLQYGYTTLFCVFQYLKVQDLLRAGCVCTMWRDLSRYPALWKTVRMKNSQIHSFEGMANALREHGTVHLDLRKMLLPSNATDDDIWPSFTNAIKKVESLRRIELCRCLASVVEDLARNNHNLEVINAVTIKCDAMTFEPFKNLTNLVDLRLKSTAGLRLSSDLSALKSSTNLKHLSITSIKDLNKLNIEVIGELVNLEVLDLGECQDFPQHFGSQILSKLTKLEKLRLEKGQGDCHTFDLLDAVKSLRGLQQLELVNFDIKAGFDKSLGACSNIKKLLIIPTYISQSATTNHMVLGGVLRLQKTLSHFVWGVTLELLRVTQLFVSQQSNDSEKKEGKDKDTNSESIPVLKPVPLHGIQETEVAPASDTPQVEILPLANLKNLLLQNLPTTRVKIVKIPFHSTWRQSITDSGN